MLGWDWMLWVKLRIRWGFGDVPFLTHVLRRLVDSGHIGSFDRVNYGPGDGSRAVMSRIRSSGGNDIANMGRILLVVGIPGDIMVQWQLGL
jgi:hypothetical protein